MNEYNVKVKELKEKIEKYNIKIDDESFDNLVENAIGLMQHIGTSFSIHDIEYNLLLDDKYGNFNDNQKNTLALLLINFIMHMEVFNIDNYHSISSNEYSPFIKYSDGEENEEMNIKSIKQQLSEQKILTGDRIDYVDKKGLFFNNCIVYNILRNKGAIHLIINGDNYHTHVIKFEDMLIITKRESKVKEKFSAQENKKTVDSIESQINNESIDLDGDVFDYIDLEGNVHCKCVCRDIDMTKKIITIVEDGPSSYVNFKDILIIKRHINITNYNNPVKNMIEDFAAKRKEYKNEMLKEQKEIPNYTQYCLSKFGNIRDILEEDMIYVYIESLKDEDEFFNLLKNLRKMIKKELLKYEKGSNGFNYYKDYAFNLKCIINQYYHNMKSKLDKKKNIIEEKGIKNNDFVDIKVKYSDRIIRNTKILEIGDTDITIDVYAHDNVKPSTPTYPKISIDNIIDIEIHKTEESKNIIEEKGIKVGDIVDIKVLLNNDDKISNLTNLEIREIYKNSILLGIPNDKDIFEMPLSINDIAEININEKTKKKNIIEEKGIKVGDIVNIKVKNSSHIITNIKILEIGDTDIKIYTPTYMYNLPVKMLGGISINIDDIIDIEIWKDTINGIKVGRCYNGGNPNIRSTFDGFSEYLDIPLLAFNYVPDRKRITDVIDKLKVGDRVNIGTKYFTYITDAVVFEITSDSITVLRTPAITNHSVVTIKIDDIMTIEKLV